jgi:multicomponent Na+:H+ antiporter subunit D
MAAFAVGAVGMIGLPPTAGFLGKWFMLSSAMQTQQWLPVGVIILSTILNAAYFLPIVVRAFFAEAAPHPQPAGAAVPHDVQGAAHGEAPWPMVLALLVTATATVALFLAPDVPLKLAQDMLTSPPHARP